MLRVGAWMGVVVYVPSVYLAYLAGAYGLIVMDTIAVITVVGLHRAPSMPYRMRATGFCLTLFMLGIGLLITVGPISQIYLIGACVLTSLLLGRTVGLWSSVLATLMLLAFGAAAKWAPTMVILAWTEALPSWLIITLNFTLVNTLVTLAVGAVVTAANSAIERALTTRESLDAERTLLRTLVETLPDVIFTKNRGGQFELVNPATVALIGVRDASDLVGRTVFDIMPYDVAKPLDADDRMVMEGHALVNREEQVLSMDGRTRWLLTMKVPQRNAAGDIIGLIGISRDITDRRELEEQLRQSHKMEAVGRLAGGIAHDFNNLLTVIGGHSDLLLSDAHLDQGTRESIESIRGAGMRAAALTRQLLAFSRQSVLRPRVIDVNAVVSDTSRMLRRLIGEDVELRTDLEPHLRHVRVDPGQLDQVLMNLTVNARDAMPRGGTLTISTANVDLDEEFAAQHPDCHVGPHVMLTIADTGEGMSAEVLARIFEPFFTTKGVGKGTGLGLSMVLGIVQQSGGTIHTVSEPGHGTRLAIYLPAVDEPIAETRQVAPAPDGGYETILLVEDEDGVRELALQSLRTLGYEVLTARDGADALRVAANHPRHIDLLLTDVVMPNMNGPELASALQADYPALRVLFISGYPDDRGFRHGVLDATVSLLEKPFTPAILSRRVRDVLDSAG
jgi:two-component system cell cycle sensor histidine kinase/response regulator CckA